MFYYYLSKRLGSDIAKLICSFMTRYDNIVPEMEHKNLLADIRGERYVPILENGLPCYECYGYTYIEDNGLRTTCGSRRGEHTDRVIKISYLRFLANAVYYDEFSLYLTERFIQIGPFATSDIMGFTRLSARMHDEIYDFNLKHIDYLCDNKPIVVADDVADDK